RHQRHRPGAATTHPSRGIIRSWAVGSKVRGRCTSAAGRAAGPGSGSRWRTSAGATGAWTAASSPGPPPGEAMAKRERFRDRRRDGFTMPKGRQPYVSEWMLHWLHNIARREVEATTWDRSYRQKVTGLIVPYFER